MPLALLLPFKPCKSTARTQEAYTREAQQWSLQHHVGRGSALAVYPETHSLSAWSPFSLVLSQFLQEYWHGKRYVTCDYSLHGSNFCVQKLRLHHYMPEAQMALFHNTFTYWEMVNNCFSFHTVKKKNVYLLPRQNTVCKLVLYKEVQSI